MLVMAQTQRQVVGDEEHWQRIDLDPALVLQRGEQAPLQHGAVERATQQDLLRVFVTLQASDQLQAKAWHEPITENPTVGSTEVWEIVM